MFSSNTFMYPFAHPLSIRLCVLQSYFFQTRILSSHCLLQNLLWFPVVSRVSSTRLSVTYRALKGPRLPSLCPAFVTSTVYYGRVAPLALFRCASLSPFCLAVPAAWHPHFEWQAHRRRPRSDTADWEKPFASTGYLACLCPWFVSPPASP